MSDLPPFDNPEVAEIAERKRQRIIASRNRALGLVLAALVVLFFAVTIAKMHQHSPIAGVTKQAATLATPAQQGEDTRLH